ncbi:hypothetical protein [Salmonirosea aquatica]|uniref:Uncharacterized protein n=1 Tax=Salmonirosea aquatica TaxID=2654236 RepID=A0A7C9BCY2_9BACT|nr:hypothetical protein [Cytophagaceae bacterium SJW1-29]
MKDNSDMKSRANLNGSAGLNGSAETHIANDPASKKSQPKAAEINKIRRFLENLRQTTSQVKADQEEDLKPGQILTAKISAIISKYPFQTIGGLLALLLVIVLFKTFYQGKHWQAKRTAEEAFYVANEYARNNSTNLYPYLSNAFRREVRELPGLLPLSMQNATRGGTITAAEAVALREITPDSVVVEVNLVFGGDSGKPGLKEKCFQALVYEKEHWRLGLSYNR